MKELVNLRKEREKHFLNDDGTITAYMYDEDIHYLDNGEYKEIDNTLIEESEYITNKNNNFKIKLYKNKYLVNIDLDNNDYLNTTLKNSFGVSPKIVNDEIIYEDVLPNVDFHYLIHGKSLKENIYLKEKINTNIIFNIDTNLELVLENNKVLAKNNDKIVYTFEPVFMKDSNNNINRNCHYSLIENNEHYELELVLDENYLANATYPVLVDPSIKVDEDNNVFDTYIYDGDSQDNRNSQDLLKVGVDENNKAYRILTKFKLPDIGTSSSVVSATASYVTHKDEVPSEMLCTDYIGLYALTCDWDETVANWNIMYDKAEDYCQQYKGFKRTKREISGNDTIITLETNSIDITNLVKEWYTNRPNYGYMLKMIEEKYDGRGEHLLFSKNNSMTESLGSNPKPYLTLTYRSRNGLYTSMPSFTTELSLGKSVVNLINGNVVNTLALNRTTNSKITIDLVANYNSNDVVEPGNSLYFANGWRFNYDQFITKRSFGNKEYLEYVNDTGYASFFSKDGEKYVSEDGLKLEIRTSDNQIIVEDNNSSMIFSKRGNKFLLSEIKNNTENLTIKRNSEGRIEEIEDSNNKKVTIEYLSNKISINGCYMNTVLNVENNKLLSIESKFGKVIISYNETSLVKEITDIDKQKVCYEYYKNKPYKIKRIATFGIDGTNNTQKDFIYALKNTTIINKDNQKISYSFNENDQLTSTLYYDKSGYLQNCFGYNNTYKKIITTPSDNGTIVNKFDKLSTSSIEHQPIINLISNDEFYNKLKKCEYVEKKETESQLAFDLMVTGTIQESIYVADESNDYTLSLSIKKNGSGISNIQLLTNGSLDSNIVEISDSNDFVRYHITRHFEVNDDIVLRIETSSEIHLTDIQLEKSSIANNYNLLQNGDFHNLFNNWSIIPSKILLNSNDLKPLKIVSIDDKNRACLIESYPFHSYILNQALSLEGIKGDALNLSFIYRNSGLHSATEDDFEMYGSKISLRFFPKNTQEEKIETFELEKNSSWEIFNYTFIAPYDYDMVIVELSSLGQINELYVTHFTLLKDITSLYLNYDENGNLLEFSDYSNEKTKINYNENNQIDSIIFSGYKNFNCEYEKSNKKKLINILNEDGIKQSFLYNNQNMIDGTIIKNIKNSSDKNVKIRLKGTNKYLTPNYTTRKIVLKEFLCNSARFNFIKHNNKYKITLSPLQNMFIDNYENMVIMKKTNNPLEFEIIDHSDLSVSIKEIKSGKCLYANDDLIELRDYNEEDENFYFFIESSDDNKFLSSSYIYNEETKKYMNTLGNSVNYEVDVITNLITKITNPLGLETKYEYNDKNQMTKIESAGKVITYKYNNQNKISEISSENKVYTFVYDEFLNTKEIKINDVLLVSYIYDNNLLKKLLYGNGYYVEYKYDNSNRLKEVISKKENETISVTSYTYDNLNNIKKVISNGIVYNYDYNLLKKIASLNVDNKFFNCSTYSNGLMLCKTDFTYLNLEHALEFVYSNSGSLTKTNIHFGDKNENISYTYDSLGRIKIIKINGNTLYSQDYINIGEKTSLLIKSITMGDDFYQYKYNNIGNIISKYCNNKLAYSYEYDNLSRVTKEYDYIEGSKTEYTYNSSGNITNVKKINLETSEIISRDEYSYSNNLWEDQLTKFNNVAITYDNIGNPLTIGENQLTWKNGRQLSSYITPLTTINYMYNHEGYRVSKNVNNSLYKYYYTDGNLIVEDRDGAVIRYLYDENSGLIGFIFNATIYYYQKNSQGDIEKILDSNLNTLVVYKYDVWGRVLSIIDNSTNHIGTINPFRYRGYYYDEETNLYYLNTRYYNPIWRRFINADGIINAEKSIDGYNLYTYVGNNPVNKFDSNGNRSMFNSIKRGINKVTTILKNTINFIYKTINNAKNTSPKITSNNTKRVAPKVSTSSKKSVNIIDAPLTDVRYDNSTSISNRESNFFDVTIDNNDDDGKINIVFDIGNNSMSFGDDGIEFKNKVLPFKSFSPIVKMNFANNDFFDFASWKMSLSFGVETGNNYFSNEQTITVEQHPLLMGLELGLLATSSAYNNLKEAAGDFVENNIKPRIRIPIPSFPKIPIFN